LQGKHVACQGTAETAMSQDCIPMPKPADNAV